MHAELFQQFQNRTVLVTGHTGFKGSWLTLWLKQLGARVVGLALDPPTAPSLFHEAGVESQLDEDLRIDIRDRSPLVEVIDRVQPDLVLHLAAQTVVRTGYREPVETFDTNVMGTVHLLEAIRLAGRPAAVLVISSDKCYENREQVWGYRESDAMGEHDPYGGSKGCTELVVRSYQHSFFPIDRIEQHGVWLASARAGNVIGGGDWTRDALLVDAVAALRQGEPVRVRNPQAVRPWQHVLQCLSGYLTVAARLLEGRDRRMCDGWNIGPLPGNELTVREVIEHFLDCWGGGDWEDISASDQPPEANILRLSIEKAINQLRWRPIWNVYTGLRLTADWFQQYCNDPGSAAALCREQINHFQTEFFQACVGPAPDDARHHSPLPPPQTPA